MSIARYGAGERPWPCGAHSGEVPGLMLGLAGIGHAFLRLHDAAVPSVLMFRADAPAAPIPPSQERETSRDQVDERLLVTA